MINIKRIILLFIIMFSFTCIPVALPAEMDSEVSYLLIYIRDSNCNFIRNGKSYTSSKAKQHLEYKYNYAKSRLSTAEDFVRQIASKSSRSGKAYAIDCGGELTPSEEWLMTELTRYRQKTQKNSAENSGSNSKLWVTH
jgi:hypothetical protein